MTEDNPELWFLELPHARIVELIAVLEGYEGMAVPRVLEKSRGLVELLVAPDLADPLSGIIRELNSLFPIRRIPRPEGVKSIADELDQDPGPMSGESSDDCA